MFLESALSDHLIIFGFIDRIWPQGVLHLDLNNANQKTIEKIREVLNGS